MKIGLLDSDKLERAVSEFFITIIIAAFQKLSLDWLVIGSSNMLRSAASKEALTVCQTVGSEDIPLIATEAMAGYFTRDTQVQEHECEKFIIQTFKGAEFLYLLSSTVCSPSTIAEILLRAKTIN
ncbi:MAG: hypothetical protein ACRC9X_02665 [Bacteroidales bacterium]